MRKVKLTKESTKDILENLLKRSPNNYGKYEDAVAEYSCQSKSRGDDSAFFAYTREFDKVRSDKGYDPCNPRRRDRGSLSSW